MMKFSKYDREYPETHPDHESQCSNPERKEVQDWQP